MSFIIRPIVLSIVLILIAAVLEINMLKKSELSENKRKIVITIVSLIISSISIYLVSYTDTLFDASMISLVIIISFSLMLFSMYLIYKKYKFHLLTTFIIHFIVGIILTGVEDYSLIFASWYFGMFTLFSLMYFYFRSSYKNVTAKFISSLIILLLIIIRLIISINLDIDDMSIRKVNHSFELTEVYRSKPLEAAVDYFNNKIGGNILKIDSIGEYKKGKGLLVVIEYKKEGKNKNIRLLYKNNSIIVQ